MIKLIGKFVGLVVFSYEYLDYWGGVFFIEGVSFLILFEVCEGMWVEVIGGNWLEFVNVLIGGDIVVGIINLFGVEVDFCYYKDVEVFYMLVVVLLE